MVRNRETPRKTDPGRSPSLSVPPALTRNLEGLTEDLVRLDTSKDPTDGFSLIEDFCAREGILTRLLWRTSSHKVLLAGKRATRVPLHVLLATHIDTVPQVDNPRWEPGTRSGSRLHGRGALDMKAGLALALCLLREFTSRTAKTRQPRVDMSVLITSDEEGASEGAWRFAERGMVNPNLVLIPEPTWERVATSAYGRRSWNLRFTSKGGHAHGNFQSTASPAAAMATALVCFPKDVIPVSLVTEGEGEVTLPTVASARLEYAFAGRSDPERTERLLARAIRQSEREHPGVHGNIKLRERKTPWLDPYTTDMDNPPLVSFLRSVKRVTGRVELITEKAVGDFNVFGVRYPTLVFGPSGAGAHGRDEWVDLRSLARCWAVYADFLAGLPI